MIAWTVNEYIGIGIVNLNRPKKFLMAPIFLYGSTCQESKVENNYSDVISLRGICDHFKG